MGMLRPHRGADGSLHMLPAQGGCGLRQRDRRRERMKGGPMVKSSNETSLYNKTWKARFSRLLALTFKTHSLDPVVFDADAHTSVKEFVTR